MKKNLLRIINCEGVEVLYDLDYVRDMTARERCMMSCCRKHAATREIQEKVLLSDRIVSFAKRDNYKLELPSFNQNEKHRHFILEKEEFKPNDLLRRLINRCQEYKVNLEILKYQSRIKQANLKEPRVPNILNELYKVEYRV